MNRWVVLAIIPVLAIGCSDGENGPVETTLPPGEPRVVLTRMTATDSRVTNVTTTIDSVNARFETATCFAEGTSACPTTDRQSGDVPQAALNQPFETAQSADVRALRAEYRAGDDNTPPDGGWTILTIRAGSLEKTVQWETNYPVPAVLARIVCEIDGIRGSLSLCAG
jgi:hypothetical protein